MSVKRAAKLYEDFRERPARRARSVRLKLPRAVMVMGYCDVIQYRTTHGGKSVRYKHTFAPGSKPLLCAGPGRNQLFLIGGRYHVTERGIVDLTPRGRELED
jgi:hypothetical protein